jgi:hypothetical protein
VIDDESSLVSQSQISQTELTRCCCWLVKKQSTPALALFFPEAEQQTVQESHPEPPKNQSRKRTPIPGFK